MRSESAARVQRVSKLSLRRLLSLPAVAGERIRSQAPTAIKNDPLADGLTFSRLASASLGWAKLIIEF
jgi:hypothetical protein